MEPPQEPYGQFESPGPDRLHMEDAGGGDFGETPDRSPKGYAWIAWVIILIGVVALVGSRFFFEEEPEEKNAKNDIAIMLMEFQGKFAVGVAADPDATPNDIALIYGQLATSAQNMGLDERQRLVVLAAELQGPDEAAHQLELIDQELTATMSAPGGETSTQPDQTTGLGPLNPEQGEVHKILHELYSPLGTIASDNLERAIESGQAPEITPAATIPDARPRVESLSQAQRDLLINEMRWYGRLALNPPGSADQAARQSVLEPAKNVYWLLNIGTLAALIAGIVGFIGLIILIVLASVRTIRGSFGPGAGHHGIYAETFAIWGVLFIVLQVGAGLVAYLLPDYALLLVFVAFMAGLSALAWPVIRGLSWSTVRSDIGWTLGRNPLLEIAMGPAGYVLGIPIFAVGVLITLGLFVLQQILSGNEGPTQTPSHPMVQQLFQGDVSTYLQLLLLGSVAAPIVEETMFRGVLYRHLRDATGKWPTILSMFFGMFVNSFIFAVIHPQGLIAVPALMGLAFNFTLMREWRGTLIPSIIMHAIQNGLVFTALFLVVRQQ